jgi:hypothetical protein
MNRAYRVYSEWRNKKMKKQKKQEEINKIFIEKTNYKIYKLHETIENERNIKKALLGPIIIASVLIAIKYYIYETALLYYFTGIVTILIIGTLTTIYYGIIKQKNKNQYEYENNL